MKGKRDNQPVRLPLLDSLLEGEAADHDRSPERTLQALRKSFLRDLEVLFNTRPFYVDLDTEHAELRRSVLGYGLPTLEDYSAPARREEFRRRLAEVMLRFDRRLKDLEIEIVSGADPLDRTLRFRVRALIDLEAVEHEVVYFALLDPGSENLKVLDGGSSVARLRRV